MSIDDVNPFDIWLRKNPELIKKLDFSYNENINKINNSVLRNDLINLYNDDIKYSYQGRNNKFLVVTLLLAMKLHFGD